VVTGKDMVMHPGRRGDRVLGWVRGAGLLVLLGGLVWLTVALVFQGVDRAGRWVPVLGVGVAMVGTLVTLVTSWLQQRPAVGELAGAAQVARAAEELRAAVWEQWRREAEVRSLGDPDPMPVRWRLSDPAVMDHDEHIGPIPPGCAWRSDRIPALLEAFRRLSRHRLVIIGGPGSGKTTLAVQLVLHLLKDWQTDQPVPVLLSLASWDPQAQPRAQDWLADQLTQTYPDLRAFGTGTAHRLADQGRLLPVLDGLDEIAPQRRREVIERLNASLDPDTGLILTSRTAEYTDTVRTSRVLTAAAVIQPQPLTPGEAAAYLTDRLPRHPDESWQAVLTALQNGTAGALDEVVASPLGLWLLCVVHLDGHHDAQPLIDPGRYPDAGAIQHHLLEELIPAAVRARPPRHDGQDPLRPQRQHDPEQVRRWLTTVAIELRNTNTRDWRWWRLARHTLTTRQSRLVVELVVGLVYGLAVGLVSGLVSGLAVGWMSGLAVGWVYGLAVGLVSGLVYWLVGWSVFRDRDAPVHADFRLRGRARALGVKLALGLVGGDREAPGYTDFGLRNPAMALGVNLVFRLVLALVGVLVFRLVFGLVGLLVIWLMGGLVLGLISFVTSPSIARRASSPVDSQRGDRRLSLLVAGMLTLMSGLVGGLIFGLGFEEWYGSWFGLRVGAGFRLVEGLVFVLLIGALVVMPMGGSCWPRFAVASLWLWAQRRLPLYLMGFLDDAYRLGLLRIVGPVYQFRHAALQDHLAPPAQSITAAVSPSTPLRT
jgi:NACHT domain